MKQRNKQEMAEYQQKRRLAAKQAAQDASELINSVTPDCNTPVNVTPKVVTPAIDVTPTSDTLLADKIERFADNIFPADYGSPTCQCMHCQQNRRSQHPAILNHGTYKRATEAKQGEYNRVRLPCDTDYIGADKQINPTQS